MIQVGFHDPQTVEDAALQFVVSVSRYQNRWVFCRHKRRKTWEIPGGRREPGESVMEAMKRELWEETGALDARIRPICPYSVTQEDVTTYGMLFFSEINSLESLPRDFEIGEIMLADHFPEEQTYPDIQPELFHYTQGWLNRQSHANELWDVYDADRKKTGILHRRGDPMPEGQYHLVVHIWIQNQEGKFLLTKRSPNKGFPNMWESTGGSALAGEDSLTAAIREVREETGITLELDKGRLLFSETCQDFLRDVWLFQQDFSAEDVVLQPGETVDKQCADQKEILRLLEAKSLVPYTYLDRMFALI